MLTPVLFFSLVRLSFFFFFFVQVFKMTALRGLRLIFPADVNPLYAGFGNSVGDMVAYAKVI